MKQYYRYYLTQFIVKILNFLEFFKFDSPEYGRWLMHGFALIYGRFTISEHRRVLEGVIIQLPKKKPKVMVVGMKSYNMHYIPFWKCYGQVLVVEPNDSFKLPININRKYSKLENLKIKEKFDIIDISGVYGYGLNDQKDLKKALLNVVNFSNQNTQIIFDITCSLDKLNLINKLHYIKSQSADRDIRIVVKERFTIVILSQKGLSDLCDTL